MKPTLYLCCVILFSLLLWHPHRKVYRNVAPRIAVLLDDSESMRCTDFNRAEQLAQTLHRVEGINGTFNFYSLTGITGNFESPLGHAVNILLNNENHKMTPRSETPLSAIILLSDGVTLGGVPLIEAARNCREKNVPVFCVAFGPEHEPFRFHLIHPDAPRIVGVDEPLTLGCELEVFGLETPAPFQITLESETQSIKMHEKLETATGTPIGFPLQLHEPGVHRFRLFVARENDTAKTEPLEFSIFVREEPRRVILVDATPRYEYRFLRELLRSRPGWELRTVLLDAAVENGHDDPIALEPQALKEISWNEYDLLILGDVGPELFDVNALLCLENIEDEEFPQLACSILCVSGTKNNLVRWNHTRLRPFFPVEFQKFNDEKNVGQIPYMTSAIRFFHDSMTPFRSFEQPQIDPLDARTLYGAAEILRPGSRLLAENEQGVPVIAVGKYKNRFVYWLGTDATWTWQNPWLNHSQRDQTKDDRTVHHEFWLRTLRQLTENEIGLPPENIPVQKTNLRELRRLRKDAVALRETARISGGRFYEPNGIQSLLTDLPQENVREFEKTAPVFPKTILVVLLVVVLFLLWKVPEK